VKIIKSKRKTISIEVSSDAEVIVRAPKRMPDGAIRAFVESQQDFIEKNLRKMKMRKAALEQIPRISEEEREALRRRAKEVIPERVRFYAPLVGVDYQRITIKSQRTRWGSCSAKGNLNFNLALLLVPPEVLDYVVVHELCHRLEMNHSARFWKQVERVYPAYKTCRKWLKDNGTKIMTMAGQD